MNKELPFLPASPAKLRAQLQNDLIPLRAQIIEHPLYDKIQRPDQLKTFASFHVFPVWDFMSLLKSLQGSLTCVSLPWVPIGSANTRYLINEIVVGEESDVDDTGQRTSHFEMYLQAMTQLGADRRQILLLLEKLQHTGYPLTGQKVAKIAGSIGLHPAICDFLDNTFHFIHRGKPHELASLFTFGREDLIPEMFMSMVRRLDTDFPETINKFRYYLERHIEVDGDYHSKLAIEMVEELCGTDPEKWEEARRAAESGLVVRLKLWDAISENI